MNLTEKQASLLIEKIIIRRPCVNCGTISQEKDPGTILKIVKMPAIIPVVETGSSKSEDVLLTFIVATCSHCGHTTFINLDAIGIKLD